MCAACKSKQTPHLSAHSPPAIGTSSVVSSVAFTAFHFLCFYTVRVCWLFYSTFLDAHDGTNSVHSKINFSRSLMSREAIKQWPTRIYISVWIRPPTLVWLAPLAHVRYFGCSGGANKTPNTECYMCLNRTLRGPLILIPFMEINWWLFTLHSLQ